jgi:hypothetical protein
MTYLKKHIDDLPQYAVRTLPPHDQLSSS